MWDIRELRLPYLGTVHAAMKRGEFMVITDHSSWLFVGSTLVGLIPTVFFGRCYKYVYTGACFGYTSTVSMSAAATAEARLMMRYKGKLGRAELSHQSYYSLFSQ